MRYLKQSYNRLIVDLLVNPLGMKSKLNTYTDDDVLTVRIITWNEVCIGYIHICVCYKLCFTSTQYMNVVGRPSTGSKLRNRFSTGGWLD